MFYRLLGMLVWRGGKWFLRRKYAVARTPLPLVAGLGAVAVAGAVMAVRRRSDAS